MREKNQENQTDNPTKDVFTPNLLIGMTKEQSFVYLDYHNILHRVVSEDDQHYILTAEHNPKRYNLILLKNKITAYNLG